MIRIIFWRGSLLRSSSSLFLRLALNSEYGIRRLAERKLSLSFSSSLQEHCLFFFFFLPALVGSLRNTATCCHTRLGIGRGQLPGLSQLSCYQPWRSDDPPTPNIASFSAWLRSLAIPAFVGCPTAVCPKSAQGGSGGKCQAAQNEGEPR